MILKRILFAPFCASSTSKHHLKITELVKRMATAQETLNKQQLEINELVAELKEKQQINMKQNNEIHQMRVRLTDDLKKVDSIWSDAKKQIKKNQSQAIKEFGKGLTQLGDQINRAAKLKTQQHSSDLKEGFDLTARLFYTSLEKFNIKMTDVKLNDQLKKGEAEKVGEQKTDKTELKGKVAKVIEQGWLVEGNLAKLPKVIVWV